MIMIRKNSVYMYIYKFKYALCLQKLSVRVLHASTSSFLLKPSKVHLICEFKQFFRLKTMQLLPPSAVFVVHIIYLAAIRHENGQKPCHPYDALEYRGEGQCAIASFDRLMQTSIVKIAGKSSYSTLTRKEAFLASSLVSANTAPMV